MARQGQVLTVVGMTGKRESAGSVQAALAERVVSGEFDFLDFGSSLGKSLEFGVASLGGRRGLGIDRDPDKVARALEAGHECLCADLTDLALPDDCVDFVVINHVLEHLPDARVAAQVLHTATRVARRFVYVSTPWFDADAYLDALGLKFYWSDWNAHPFHVRVQDLEAILRQLGVERYRILARELITTSRHHAIHPLEAPPNAHHYETHFGYKPLFEFSRPVFRELVCIIGVGDFDGFSKVLKFANDFWPLDALTDAAHPTQELYGKDDVIADQRRLVLSLAVQVLETQQELEVMVEKFRKKAGDAERLLESLRSLRAEHAEQAGTLRALRARLQEQE